jgi:hypothetical protein
MATPQPEPKPRPTPPKPPIELPQTIFIAEKDGATPAEPPPER